MRQRFWFGALGSLLAGVSVGLSAYAAHAGLAEQPKYWLQQAALFGFGHGVALAALAPLAVRRLAFAGLGCIVLGVLLFSGTLVLAALAGLPTRTAPFGGTLMMLGWLLHALGQWRK
ncbi:DUF423 domain-containing protein [Lysobacter pythonis]|uniref:DUF423 domain-containing protein n=2 Tax=Solilutibacter pythonis TaxID=2483112 RepID=A0A3M2HTJ8_9GAMM|nr:DUF423 domain-containing protein [Lysobacter pythonis]